MKEHTVRDSIEWKMDAGMMSTQKNWHDTNLFARQEEDEEDGEKPIQDREIGKTGNGKKEWCRRWYSEHWSLYNVYIEHWAAFGTVGMQE